MMRRRFITSIALATLLCAPVFASNGTDQLIEKSYQQSAEGKLDEALTTLQKAIEHDPHSSLAHTRLGGIHLLRQEYGEGIKRFQQAIMIDQNNASAFVGMSVAYLHQGKYSLARKALNEAERLDPSKKAEIAKVTHWIDQRTAAKHH